jgi:hypothetical protein
MLRRSAADLAAVWFLRRRDGGQAWWAAVEGFPSSAPALVHELRCGPSVVCERVEAEQALAWARAHPAWDDDDPALAVVSSVSGD